MQKAWQQYLAALLSLVELTEQYQKKIFISYAWPPRGSTALTNLQLFLSELKLILEKAGAIVDLDIEDLRSSIPNYMAKGVKNADVVLLIGTSILKERLSERDPDLNNAQKEYEMIRKRSADILFPLLLEGDYHTSFPDDLLPRSLVRDVTSFSLGPNQSKLNYYRPLVGLSPLGLIPAIYNFQKSDIKPLYLALLNPFLAEVIKYDQQLQLQDRVKIAEEKKVAGCHQDAFRFFLQAALSGHGLSCYRVATYYSLGRQISGNPVVTDQYMAETYFRHGAKHGHVKSMQRLAECLSEQARNLQPSIMAENSFTEALEWINNAHQQCQRTDQARMQASKDKIYRHQAQYRVENMNDATSKLVWARYLLTSTGGYEGCSENEQRQHRNTALTLAQAAAQAQIPEASALVQDIERSLQDVNYNELRLGLGQP